MAWLYLLIAGFFEVVWAIALKEAQGFKKPWPVTIMALGLVLSFVFLSAAFKHLPVGTAYAVWTGIGAVGVAAVGILKYGDSAALGRIACMALILIGILGLRLSSGK